MTTPDTTLTPRAPAPGDAVRRDRRLRAGACRPPKQDVPHTPVWFMRQAGRSLPEYRAVREGVGMLESCRRPDLVTEITLQPVRRHGVDAAIFFSDIVVPLSAIGVDLDIVAGVGPVVARPIRTRADLAQLRDLTPDDVADITESVRLLTAELGATPLIGFAGAPVHPRVLPRRGWAVEEPRAHQGAHARRPRLWHDLCAQLAQISGAFLRVQAEAGASVVQLFDSWAGVLEPRRLHGIRAAALGRGPRGRRRPRRAAHPLRRRDRRAARADGRGRRRRRRCRLPRLAHRRAGPPRRPLRRAGQPRPGPALRAVGAARAPGARHRRRGAGGAGPRLQPRPRRAARHRPRRADPRRRPACTRRPPGDPGAAGARRLVLEPLRVEHAAEMVGGALGCRAVRVHRWVAPCAGRASRAGTRGRSRGRETRRRSGTPGSCAWATTARRSGYVQATVAAGRPRRRSWPGWSGPAWQGRGIAREAAASRARARAPASGSRRVVAHVHPDHVASQRVAVGARPRAHRRGWSTARSSGCSSGPWPLTACRADPDGGHHPRLDPADLRRPVPTSLTPTGIAYDRGGPTGATPVVLLHAGVADRRMWDPQWAGLTAVRDTVRLDLRGFGDSTPRPAGPLDHVADVLATLDLLGIDACHLVGASFGAGSPWRWRSPDPTSCARCAGPAGRQPARGGGPRSFVRSSPRSGRPWSAVTSTPRSRPTSRRGWWARGVTRATDVDAGVAASVRVMQRRAFELTRRLGRPSTRSSCDPPAVDRDSATCAAGAPRRRRPRPRRDPPRRRPLEAAGHG